MNNKITKENVKITWTKEKTDFVLYFRLPDNKGADYIAKVSHFSFFHEDKTHQIAIRSITKNKNNTLTVIGKRNGWRIEATFILKKDHVHIKTLWKYNGKNISGVRLGIDVFSPFKKLNYYMIPGCTFNGNKGDGYQPKGMKCGKSPWSFREERTVVPSCMIIESKKEVLGFFTEGAKSEDLLSSCSMYPLTNGHILSIRFPFYEGPKTFYGAPKNLTSCEGIYGPPTGKTLNVATGDSWKRDFYLVISRVNEKLHGYAPVIDIAWKVNKEYVRSWYDDKTLLKLKLAALPHHWYDDGKVAGYAVRSSLFGDIHKSLLYNPITTAWCSFNLMLAYFFQVYTLEYNGDQSYIEKSKKMIKTYVDTMQPNGLFFPKYLLQDRFPKSSTCPKYDEFLNSDTAAEIFFIMKSIKLFKEHSIDIPQKWKSFCGKFCDFLAKNQLDSGSFAAKWDITTGKKHELPPNRSAGASCIRTLSIAYLFFNDKKYLECAERAAKHYIKNCVDREANYTLAYDQSGIHLWGIAVVFFGLVELYDVTKNNYYLEKAVKAAEFLTCLQYTYSVPFYPESKESLMGKYNYKTKGGDLFSVQSPGTCGWMSMIGLDYLRLWRYTGDKKWRDRGLASIKQITHLAADKNNIEDFPFHDSMIGCRPEELYPVVPVFWANHFHRKGNPNFIGSVVWGPAFSIAQVLTLRKNYPELLDEFNKDVVYPTDKYDLI